MPQAEEILYRHIRKIWEENFNVPEETHAELKASPEWNALLAAMEEYRQQAPVPSLPQDWLQQYRPPFQFEPDSGFILDQDEQPVAEVRGWGHLQSERLQDEMGEFIAGSLNAQLKQQPPVPKEGGSK